MTRATVGLLAGAFTATHHSHRRARGGTQPGLKPLKFVESPAKIKVHPQQPGLDSPDDSTTTKARSVLQTPSTNVLARTNISDPVKTQRQTSASHEAAASASTAAVIAMAAVREVEIVVEAAEAIVKLLNNELKKVEQDAAKANALPDPNNFLSRQTPKIVLQPRRNSMNVQAIRDVADAKRKAAAAEAELSFVKRKASCRVMDRCMRQLAYSQCSKVGAFYLPFVAC
jgi:hypothetical protein